MRRPAKTDVHVTDMALAAGKAQKLADAVKHPVRIETEELQFVERDRRRKRHWQTLDDVQDLVDAIRKHKGRVSHALRELQISWGQWRNVIWGTDGSPLVRAALREAQEEAVAHKMDCQDALICRIAEDDDIPPETRLKAAALIIKLYTPVETTYQPQLVASTGMQWDEAEANRMLESVEPKDIQ